MASPLKSIRSSAFEQRSRKPRNLFEPGRNHGLAAQLIRNAVLLTQNATILRIPVTAIRARAEPGL